MREVDYEKNLQWSDVFLRGSRGMFRSMCQSRHNYLDITTILLCFSYCQAQPQFQLSQVPAVLGWDSINFNFSPPTPLPPPPQGKYRGGHFKFVEPSLTVDKWPRTIWPINICPCIICPCNICPCNICPCNICLCNIFAYNICPGTKFGCLQLQPHLFGPNNQI